MFRHLKYTKNVFAMIAEHFRGITSVFYHVLTLLTFVHLVGFFFQVVETGPWTPHPVTFFHCGDSKCVSIYRAMLRLKGAHASDLIEYN